MHRVCWHCQRTPQKETLDSACVYSHCQICSCVAIPRILIKVLLYEAVLHQCNGDTPGVAVVVSKTAPVYFWGTSILNFVLSMYCMSFNSLPPIVCKRCLYVDIDHVVSYDSTALVHFNKILRSSCSRLDSDKRPIIWKTCEDMRDSAWQGSS